MKIEYSLKILKKYSNIKFCENPSSGGEVFHADGRTDMTKQTLAFRSFAKSAYGDGNGQFIILQLSFLVFENHISFTSNSPDLSRSNV